MDLGIAGRRAIVCGGSKGLGRAAALALAREGVEVVLVARTANTLAHNPARFARASFSAESKAAAQTALAASGAARAKP